MPLSVRPEPIRTASEAAPRLVWPNSCPEPSNTRSGSPLATLTIGETSHPPITRLSHPVWACRDRKSTRLNSSHAYISYAVFCLKKKGRRRPAVRVMVCGRESVEDPVELPVDDHDVGILVEPQEGRQNRDPVLDRLVEEDLGLRR